MYPVVTWFLLWKLLDPSGSYDLHQGVAYKQVDSRTFRADIYVPRNAATPPPVVLFVHGGMWSFGKKTDNADLAGFLAQEGIGSVLIDFRTAKGDGFYDQVADVKDAIRWVHAHAAEYGLDPERVGIFGSSSGGHLAGLAAYAEPEDFGADPAGTSSAVQACFLLYGAYDMAMLANNGVLPDVVEWYVGADVADHPELYSYYSPAYHIDGSEPPSLIMHGKGDMVIPIEQAEELVARLEGVGVPVDYVPVDVLGHGFARKQRWPRPWVADIMADFFSEAMK